MRFALAMLLVASVIGCSSDVTSPPPSFSGTWSALVPDEDPSINTTLTMMVTEQDGAVSGVGDLTASQGGLSATLDFSVTGTHVHPQIDLTMSFPDVGTSVFSGAFINPNQVVGQMGDVSLTLTRP